MHFDCSVGDVSIMRLESEQLATKVDTLLIDAFSRLS